MFSRAASAVVRVAAARGCHGAVATADRLSAPLTKMSRGKREELRLTGRNPTVPQLRPPNSDFAGGGPRARAPTARPPSRTRTRARPPARTAPWSGRFEQTTRISSSSRRTPDCADTRALGEMSAASAADMRELGELREPGGALRLQTCARCRAGYARAAMMRGCMCPRAVALRRRPLRSGRLSGRARVIDARNREERDQSAVTLSARQTKSAIDRRPEAA